MKQEFGTTSVTTGPLPIVGGGQSRTPADVSHSGNVVGFCAWALFLIVVIAVAMRGLA